MQSGKLALATALVIASCHVSAAIYKWTDENGITHYSDHKTHAPENPQQVEDSLPPLHLIQEPDAALTRIQQAAERERQQERRSSRRQYDRPIANRSRCNAYQRQLDKIQSRLRRGYSEPSGNSLRERRRQLQARLSDECR